MDYETLTKQSEIVLIEFFATWCPHCRRMMPIVEEVKELLDGRAAVYQLDIDQNQEIADDIDVKSVPTFIVYKNGVEQWRNSGEMDGQVLLSKVESYM